MSIQTPHMVSIGMYSFWPTALESSSSAVVENVSVPQTLYQRLIEQDHRQHRAFGFIRESYRAWRMTALQVKKAKTPPSSPIKADEPEPLAEPTLVKEEVVQPAQDHISPRAVDDELLDDVSMDFVSNPTDQANEAASAEKKRKFRKCGTSNATRVLRDWLFDPHNQEHPYPSEQEKRRLSQESGLTIKQIGIWFRNARQRLCQPTQTKTAVNQEQATSFMNLVGLRVDESTPLRRGSWSPAENAYAQKLIEQFTQGRMPLVEGTPLRSFLAVVLHCHAMRISKKFVRECSVGKITFRRDRMFNANGPEFDAVMRELMAMKALVQDNAITSTKKTMETEQEAMKVQEWFRTTTDEHSQTMQPAASTPKPAESPMCMMRGMHDQLLEDLDFDFDGVLGWGELDKAVSQIFFP